MSNFLETFLMEKPPYKEVKMTNDEISKICHVSQFVIENFCMNCGKSRTFKSTYNPLNALANEYHERSKLPIWQKFEDFIITYKGSFILDFFCQHDCNEHHYFAIMINGLYITKIGQYPTFAKEEVNKKLIKYKSLIPKYYPELTKAISAYSQNMGVPSFVYLRRVLEHLVDTKANLYKITTDQKFVDKLHEVEKHEKIIPDEFDGIKNQLYSVLSKGVHEYEENECIEMFPAVKFIIECILDAELVKKEHEQKAKEATAIIQQKLKKN